MKNITKTLIFISLLGVATPAQSPPKPVSAKPAPKSIAPLDLGTIKGNTYTNRFFGFTFSLPETWQIQEQIINKIIKDNAARETKAKNDATQKAFDQAVNRVTVFLTATRDTLGASENASIVCSIEDMRLIPAVKDGVDYLDLAINTYKRIQLPPDFKYSEVKAEKLGKTQFAYIEINKTGINQRMYATFRKGYAIFFVFTFNNKEDLETMRQILAQGNFALK
ncbi:MAG TPA: hypothetical protein VGD05_06815 [Pyrinomonadaceae bacterium]|jgi:hypothetical protein